MQLDYHMYLDDTGYSIAAQDYVMAMLRDDPELDLRVTAVSSSYRGVSSQRRTKFELLRRTAKKEPCCAVFHCVPVRYRPRDFARSIGIMLFETMNPPQSWIEAANSVDRIITASDFNRDNFLRSGVKVPIDVVPHCFDEQLFNSAVRHRGRYDRFTFLAIGTWKHKTRKNWETLVKGFYEAFENRDKVCLLVHTERPLEFARMTRSIKSNHKWKYKDTAPVFADEPIRVPFEDMPSLMKRADCYVSASLGEGFGLAGLHAMALGIPVVTTRYGGSLQYAKSELCTYIEPKYFRTYPVMDGVGQFRSRIWPVLTAGDVAKALRAVYEGYAEAKVKALRAYNYVHSHFGYAAIGPKFLEIVRKCI